MHGRAMRGNEALPTHARVRQPRGPLKFSQCELEDAECGREPAGLSNAIFGRRKSRFGMAEASALPALYSGPQRLFRSNRFGTITADVGPKPAVPAPGPRTRLIAHSGAARPIGSELMYA